MKSGGDDLRIAVRTADVEVLVVAVFELVRGCRDALVGRKDVNLGRRRSGIIRIVGNGIAPAASDQ